MKQATQNKQLSDALLILWAGGAKTAFLFISIRLAKALHSRIL